MMDDTKRQALEMVRSFREVRGPIATVLRNPQAVASLLTNRSDESVARMRNRLHEMGILNKEKVRKGFSSETTTEYSLNVAGHMIVHALQTFTEEEIWPSEKEPESAADLPFLEGFFRVPFSGVAGGFFWCKLRQATAIYGNAKEGSIIHFSETEEYGTPLSPDEVMELIRQQRIAERNS